MKRELMEITDELLACYLDGKLTGEEKAGVERYLAEHDEAMDAVIQARYAMGFKRVKRRFYVAGVVALVVLACLAFWVWRMLTPIQMKVNITEDTRYAIPALPFEGGVLECDYAGNALQRIAVGPESRTVFLNDIPYRFKGRPVHLVFEAAGYQPIDTLVKTTASVTLAIRRNDDLGTLFGRVTDFETGLPVEGATVRLLDLQATTDAAGQFCIKIPFGQQDEAQRVLVTKEGYLPWDELYRPSATEPWLVSLEKGGRP